MTDVRNLIDPGRELVDDTLERVRGLGDPAREHVGDAVGYVRRETTVRRLLIALVAAVAVGLLVGAVVARRGTDEEEPDAGADDAQRPESAVRAKGA